MRVLLLNQVFYPDVVSTGQHASDLAQELVGRGHDVTVICSRRGYDDPTRRFPPAEVWRKIKIRRVNCLGFPKSSKLGRALVFASFLLNCAIMLAHIQKFDVVVAMTSPPLVSLLASTFVRIRGGRLVFWVMDLNPDEAIAAGYLREKAVTTNLLTRVLLDSLERARDVVVLDRFMQERIQRKGVPEEKIKIIPPWPHDRDVAYDPDGRRQFRARHRLSGKFVVMYSGNHSPCHPLDTLLEAADRLSDRSDIVFCFVGGGAEFRKVSRFARERKLTNIVCLPYQPLNALSASLSAADLHVVVLGTAFVGLVHPCKIYNILSLGVPVLYIGPANSHVTELLPQDAAGKWAFLAEHGDAALVASHVEHAAATLRRREMSSILPPDFTEPHLVSRMCTVIESGAEPLAMHARAAESQRTD